ncbi:leucine-rich repeat protein [bacterium]|nr:leucine-rich repeat protein [bacterium]
MWGSFQKIGDNAFYGCTNLIILTIPNSVTEIGKNAFYGIKNVFYNGNAKGAPWGAEKISDPNPNNEKSIYIIDEK